MAGDERNWPSPDDEQRDHHESAGRCSERYAYRRRQRQLCIQQTAFYVTMVTCHHHFFKVDFAIFQAMLSFTRTMMHIFV